MIAYSDKELYLLRELHRKIVGWFDGDVEDVGTYARVIVILKKLREMEEEKNGTLSAIPYKVT